MCNDRVATVYLALVALCSATYTVLELSPSSYGYVLAQIGAPEKGPVWGEARQIRSDEWAGTTALFQVCVRNGFHRVNRTSFYQEDLRNFYTLPLQDWSLVFKPEMWAYFVVSPARAFSLYWAMAMGLFLTGYFLLFRRIGLDSWVAASVALLLYFSAFTQFWWTSFAPLLTGFAWVLLIILTSSRWWVKALLLGWVMPMMAFSMVYPTYFAEFTLAGMLLVVVLRPEVLRSPRQLAALAMGGLVTGVAFYAYYHDLIPVMRHTWYPGKRVGSPGTTPVAVVLSQVFPFLGVSLPGYGDFAGDNICESGSVGSFLPLLTLCLISPRVFRIKRSLRNGLVAILSVIGLITAWQLAPVPRWIGHVLLWDHGNAERLLFISGFLLTVASLLIWREKLLSPGRWRIALFLAVGPVLSLALKPRILDLDFADCRFDLILTALALGAGVIACLAPVHARLPVLLGTLTLMNVAAFIGFNPLQPAGPIFQVPETKLVRGLREKQASTPGQYLVAPDFFGATLNGMGFRSVSHMLQSPALPVFRQYFPAMDATRFDRVFNRYSNISVTDGPLPDAVQMFTIDVPAQAFEPVRNARSVTLDVTARRDCSIRQGGAVEKIETHGDGTVIEGWAPWRGEDAAQTLRVITSRPLLAGPLLTVKRPDIAESMKDYAYARCGFRLRIEGKDGRPIRPEDLMLVASATSRGTVQVPGCGCK